MPDRIVLFRMPFAGGSSLTYASWSRPLAAAGIEMRALDSRPRRACAPAFFRCLISFRAPAFVCVIGEFVFRVD
jgi:hypothetical protein